MMNIYKRWKYRYSKLEYDIKDRYIFLDIMQNYSDYPMYDPIDGWWWCVERRFKGWHVYGVGRTLEEAYADVKEHERIQLEIIEGLKENEEKNKKRTHKENVG